MNNLQRNAIASDDQLLSKLAYISQTTKDAPPDTPVMLPIGVVRDVVKRIVDDKHSRAELERILTLFGNASTKLFDQMEKCEYTDKFGNDLNRCSAVRDLSDCVTATLNFLNTEIANKVIEAGG